MAKRTVIIIGGGIAGVSAALSLARRGIDVHIVDRADYLGGRAITYGCKASSSCTMCGVCLVSDKMEELGDLSGVAVHTRASVTALRGFPGDFTVEVTQRERWVDPDKCTACGQCMDSCTAGAIKRAPASAYPQAVVMNEAECPADCAGKCRTACAFGAIQLLPARTFTLRADGVVVATGFSPFDAANAWDLGYGRIPGVMTAMEAEEALRQHGTLLLHGQAPRRIAFVQCVGSRNIPLGRNYCSEVCCKYALRMINALRKERPDTEFTLFYMDIQSAGKGFSKVYEECKAHARFVSGMPVEIKKGKQGVLVRYEDQSSARVAHAEFDLVVLSTGIWPREDAALVGRRLGLNLDEHGFFDETGHFATRRPGVVVAGACAKPMTIADAIAHAQGAAMSLVSRLEAEVSS